MRVFARSGGMLVLLTILAVEGICAQDSIETALDRIHREYSAATQDVARLVLLDQELRELIPYYAWKERPWLPATYLRPDYDNIGIFPGLFERDVLTYSGKLLAEAHAHNPNSPFRNYTLYSTIFGKAGETSNGVPSPDAAEAYVREFPQGPFIVDVHLVVAHFYDDLFKVITLEEAGQRIGYKFDCYDTYLKAQPLAEQRQRARESAIRHYERLVDLLPRNADQARYLADLRQERSHGWFYCGD